MRPYRQVAKRGRNRDPALVSIEIGNSRVYPYDRGHLKLNGYPTSPALYTTPPYRLGTSWIVLHLDYPLPYLLLPFFYLKRFFKRGKKQQSDRLSMTLYMFRLSRNGSFSCEPGKILLLLRRLRT